MTNPQPAVRVDAREAERLARIAAMRKRDHVRLTPYEIQSGLDRVRLAELLIQQLPADHDGRNTWLHNYAGKKHEDDRVALTPAPTEAGGVRLRAVSDNGKRWRVIPEDGDWEMVPTGYITAGQAKAVCERIEDALSSTPAADAGWQDISTALAAVERLANTKMDISLHEWGELSNAILTALGHDPCRAAHPDDLAVDRFAVAMKAKLAKKRADGRGGWEDKEDCSNDFLSRLLRDHVGKGDPVDVGNLAMMIHQRGERIE